jgi:hypothetical protein
LAQLKAGFDFHHALIRLNRKPLNREPLNLSSYSNST